MAKTKKRTRKTIRLWTAQDLKHLKQMNRQKVPTMTIAKRLRRSLAALYMNASQQGISLKK